MKKIITTILFLTPFCLFSQTNNEVLNKSKQTTTLSSSQLNTDEELDPEYIEVDIQIYEDNTIYKYPDLDSMTDQEEYNYELKQIKTTTGNPKK